MLKSPVVRLVVTFSLITIAVMLISAVSPAQSTPMYSVDERQARALEDIAETLKEMKRCACK